jgi:hypothetical protein
VLAGGDEQRDLPQGGGDPGERRPAAVGDDRLERLEPPPEDLGDEVVLRPEVGVGGGGRHPGSLGHVAHRQPVVAHLAQLDEGRIDQRIDPIGLPPGQLASRRVGGRRAGHVSRH